jgi:hypothetical protein
VSTPPPTLADISTGNSTHVNIKITYAMFVAVCLIFAMRRAHEAQPEIERNDLRLGATCRAGLEEVAVAESVAEELTSPRRASFQDDTGLF